ncbi:MAG: hypothetical protein JO125_05035 [Chloroflexi bacterium]|nr:hypothetical protein [Chloroflexota bacterium]
MSEIEQEQQQSDEIALPIEWHVPKDVQITSLRLLARSLTEDGLHAH